MTSSANVAFPKVAILGLGLIGGSLALALRQLENIEIRGYDRSPKSLQGAKALKLCDEYFSDPKKAVEGADLVVFAIPVSCMEALAQKIKNNLKPNCLLTDVGSTKKEVTQKLQKTLTNPVEFLGGHPIAGTEKSGPQSAQPHLFQDKLWILTPTPKNRKSSLQRLKKLLERLKIKVQILSPEQHDEVFAWVSHFPHLLAFSFMDLTREKKEGSLKFAGSGFRDFTRIAASSPEVWTSIFMSNAKKILSLSSQFRKKLLEFEALIRQSNVSKLQSQLTQISQKRKSLEKSSRPSLR